MKKFTLIAALLVATALVMSCASSGGAQKAEMPLGDANVVLVTLDTSFIKDGKPLNAEDIALGRGWIVGEQFEMVQSANPGSFIRLTVSGTKNLDWGSIGAVGIKKVEDQVKRIDFQPKGGGTYIVDIPIADLLKKIKGEKEAIGVNVWGDHKIDKVELYLY
ncbi:MAG: hypothetical protein LBI04_11195 [Treponema sp.]|jgi:hypothetical protein|nr:hypothetical protein [Treponema sp.]